MKATNCRIVWACVLFALLLGLWVTTGPDPAVCLGQRSDSAPFDTPRADRDLTQQEMEELVTLSCTLIDKRKDWGDREVAANRLGEVLPHKYCIPALLCVLRNENDHPGVRQKCVLAISWIADKSVVDYLIEALLDHDRNVAIQAHVQLRKLTHQPFHYDKFNPDPTSQMRKELHKRWHNWWEAHREDARIWWDEAHMLY